MREGSKYEMKTSLMNYLRWGGKDTDFSCQMQMQMLTQGSVDRTAEIRHLILKDICNRPLEAGDIIPLIFHAYIQYC